MTAIDTQSVEHIPSVSLEQRREILAARLDDGFNKIEHARENGVDTTRWEEGWFRLLAEYEQICDQIAGRPLNSTA